MLSGIILFTSLFLFLEIFASLRQRQRRVPAFLNSSPKHLLRERHRAPDIFLCFFSRSLISEVSFSRQQLVWPFSMVLLLERLSRNFRFELPADCSRTRSCGNRKPPTYSSMFSRPSRRLSSLVGGESRALGQRNSCLLRLPVRFIAGHNRILHVVTCQCHDFLCPPL